MKKTLVIVLCLLVTTPVFQAQAQIPLIDVLKGAVKKVIKAVDLQIQRQQNKIIWLQNAQKTLENAMSKLKLNEISEWTEKQRKLYDDYFQELRKVKNLISTYKKTKGIITRQVQLVEEYKKAWNLLRQDKHFSARELDYMYKVYTGILDESLKNLDQLFLVTNAFATQMTDGKRLELIHTASDNLEKNLTDMRGFNNRNYRISLSRADDITQAEMLKKLYGLQ
ncbi:conjugal transfer protein TraI [Pedobacter steynii]|uniref:conjugal transfer protein TraI n=1 Tax=Pedobacter steynii TaxID=430522 RepID=UPI001F24774F|nr:conjugal transfer protein TraI [Pedobacter steynii]